jgi:hypothetical protein
MSTIVTGFGRTRQCVAWLTRYAAPVRSWLAILVTLVACKDHNVEQLTAIKARVCACKTSSCAEQELARVPQGALPASHRMQALARDMMDCLARLQAAERPSTDPDAEGADTERSAAGSAAAPASGPRTAAPASARTR